MYKGEKMNWKKIKQSSYMLMMVIIISKLIGMLRDIVLAKYYGTSNISDAYLIASSVPVLLFYFIGHSLSTAYIPMYNKVKYEKGEESAIKYSNNLLNVSLIISTIIFFVLIFSPNIVIKIFANGFDFNTSNIASKLIRISSISIYFMTIIHICGGYLQANNSFLAPAAISLPRNMIIIASIILSASFGIDILGLGLLLAYVLEFIFLLPFTVKEGYKYKWRLDFHDENLKETLYIVMPILLGTCVSQINKIIDKSIASTVIVGGVSALSYASIINNAIQEVLVTGIITILFSNCAQLVAQNKHKLVSEKLSSTIKVIIFFLIPASVGVIIFAEQIVRLILCRGNFDVNSIKITTGALRSYTIGLLFLAIRDTLVKVFYAYKETKITTVTSMIAILINIILNIILSKFMGINGLALATSISAMFHCITLYIILHKKIGDFGHKSNINTLIKCCISSIIMGVIAICIYNKFKLLFGNLGSFIISILISVIVYFITTYILGCNFLINLLKKDKHK